MAFVTISELNQEEPVPGFKARFVHSTNMTVVYWDVSAGAELPEHSHPHEQITNVLEGEFELTLDGERRRLSQGTAAVVSPNAVHSGKAITDCRLIDVFYPIRMDYR